MIVIDGYGCYLASLATIWTALATKGVIYGCY